MTSPHGELSLTLGTARHSARCRHHHDGTRTAAHGTIFVLDETAPSDLAPGGACPFLGQEAWVSAEGRFDPCCAPDAQRRTLGDFGNLHDRGLGDIWDGDAYANLVKTYRTRTLCLGCNMRRPVEST